MGGKGQTYSVDLVIGMLIFLLAIGTIYSLLNSQAAEDPTRLRIESEVIATVLTSPGDTNSVAESNQLDMNRLGGLATRSVTDYEQIKDELGIQNEFCIYLQDQDGNLVYIKDINGNEYTGVGSGSGQLNLSGLECGAKK